MYKVREPWVGYLEIDEETDEVYLSEDAPEEIREAYEKHLKEEEELEKWYRDHNKPILR